MPPRKERKSAPAKTLEGRENQLIALATNLAEKQLREGTASSQVITHYLKLGTTRERLEQEKLGRENELLTVKAEHLESAKKMEDIATEALEAFKTYAGRSRYDEDE